MKSFLKNNKFTIIAIVIFLVIVLLLVQVKNIFFPQKGNALYGNRLKGIEQVEITEKEQTKIKTNLESDSSIKTTTVRVSGKTLEVIITVNDDVSVETAKTFANKVIENCSEEQKAYYDVQVFIKKENGGNDFPIIGYKHYKKDSFTFTKDRAVS